MSSRRRQLRFRTGQINAAGGRPIAEKSRVVKTVTAANFSVSATTAGDSGTFGLTQFGEPSDMQSSTSFTQNGTADNHPSEHPQMVLNWDTARVLSSMYRFDVRFVGTDAANKDFVFAYKFGSVATAPLVFTAGTVTIDNWKDLRQSRGWVWHRFSGTQSGGSVYPSQGRIEIKVPNVKRLVQGLFDVEIEDSDLESVVTDAAAVTTVRAYLHVVIFTIDGVAFSAGDVVTDVTVYQRVLLKRAIAADEMIDEADQTT